MPYPEALGVSFLILIDFLFQFGRLLLKSLSFWLATGQKIGSKGL